MSKQVVISARIDAETAALLDKVAASRRRSRAWLVADAVKRMAEEEAEYLAFVQVGLDDIAAGRTIPHDEMLEWIDSRIEELRSRVRAKLHEGRVGGSSPGRLGIFFGSGSRDR